MAERGRQLSSDTIGDCSNYSDILNEESGKCNFKVLYPDNWVISKVRKSTYY